MLLLRHGETEWSKIGRHTGRTDLDLTEIGRAQAVAAREVLKDLDLNDPLVLSSPRRRALQTAELAGLTVDTVDEQLAEWDYGDYEGLTTPQIRENDPGWLVWTHGCPGGESVAQVQARADLVITKIAAELTQRDVLLVGHGHFSRALMTRWIDLPLEGHPPGHGHRFDRYRRPRARPAPGRRTWPNRVPAPGTVKLT